MRGISNILLVVILSVICCSSCKTPYDKGAEVILDLIDKWEGKWYENMKFDQKTAFITNDSITGVENWKFVIHSPAYIHTRFGEIDSGNGAIHRNDTLYVFQDN